MSHYLIRHAQAANAEDDRIRPLSERGRIQVERLCLSLGPFFRPTQIWHSPLTRARETATLLAQGLGLNIPFVEIPDLSPDADPFPVATLLRAQQDEIAVVGHEPNLSVLAAILTGEKPRAGMTGFATGGTLSLSPGPGGLCASEWLVRAP